VPAELRRCRHCGQPEHFPRDACLTLGQKLLGILGWVVLTGVVLGLLVGLVVWLASLKDPHAGQVCLPNAIGSGCHWEFESEQPQPKLVCRQSGPYGESVCHDG
jgi:hypothetical protein